MKYLSEHPLLLIAVLMTGSAAVGFCYQTNSDYYSFHKLGLLALYGLVQFVVATVFLLCASNVLLLVTKERRKT